MTVKIVHIADVHWRGMTRHREYRKTFEQFFKECQKLNPDYIYIGGDIVHSKTQNISPELISHLSWWFTAMAKIANVVVILGNHDGLMLNQDRMDTISPIIGALNNDRIALYKKSGTYPFANHPGYNWCVLSCFDTPGWKTARPKKGDINIALYHGAIWGSHTDLDFMLDGDDSMSIFDGYDFAMLGDIHKRQALDKEKRIWYSGSTIPQNFTETQQKGFLFWTIEDKNTFDVKFVPIQHVHPYVTLDWNSDIDMLLEQTRSFSSNSRIRIRSQERLPYAIARKIAKKLRESGGALDVVFKYDTAVKEMPVSSEVRKIAKSGTLDSRTIKKLLRTYNRDTVRGEGFWQEVDTRVDQALINSLKVLEHGNRWTIKRMEFDNTFGYGKDNVIDFMKLNGIVGLFGRNRAGKSSIPGTITYGLFNKNDRGITSNLHVVNARADYCQAAITFNVGGTDYRTERQSVKCTSRGTETVMTYLNLYEVDEDGAIIKDLSGEQRRDTEKALTGLIGTSDDFLLTSFASQGGMNNFISLGGSDRRKTICRFLGLDVFSELNKIFRDISLETKTLLKTFKGRDYKQEKTRALGKITELRQGLKEKESVLNDLGDRLEEKLSELQTIKADVIIDIDGISTLENKIDEISISLKNLGKSIETADKKAKTAKNVISGAAKALDDTERMAMAKIVEDTNKLKNAAAAIESSISTVSRNIRQNSESARLLSEVPCGTSFPNCKFISRSHRASKELPGLENSMSKLSQQLQDLLDSVDKDAYSRADNYVSNFEKRKSKVTELKLKLSTVSLKRERDISELSTKKIELNEYTTRLDTARKANDPKLVEKINLLEQEIEDMRNSKNGYNKSISTLLTKIGVNQEKLKNIQNEEEYYKKIINDWYIYEFLLTATSWKGIPATILQSMIPAINEELSSILLEPVGFTVELEIDDHKTEMYINYGDSRRPIECGSGMEKMVSSLALRVALTNISSLSKSDMLIIDEGFGSLDVANVESVTQLLQKLRNWYKLILLISHVDLVKESVDDIIEITSFDKNAKVIYE